LKWINLIHLRDFKNYLVPALIVQFLFLAFQFLFSHCHTY
jgi:hypothetical protein